MLKIQRVLFGLVALLTAGAAAAQEDSEHFAKVGAWEIATEPPQKLCKMYRFYGNKAGDHIEGLVIRYDAAREAVLLTWTTDQMAYLPAAGQLDLYLNFVTGKSIDESWGSRSFRYDKPADTYYFSHAFNGTKDSQRILRDLSKNGIIALDFGPTLLTALLLDASEATAALRECSSKLAGRASPVPE